MFISPFFRAFIYQSIFIIMYFLNEIQNLKNKIIYNFSFIVIFCQSRKGALKFKQGYFIFMV